MTPEQNIEGHAFNALTASLGDDPWLPLSQRLRHAKAVVAAVEPVIRACEQRRFLEVSKDFPEPFRTIIAGAARPDGEL